MEESLSVILPVYNEEDNIENVVMSIILFIPKIVKDFEIILIDDGSTDMTSAIVDRLSKEQFNLRVIHHPKNMGYGTALRSGFNLAQHKLIFFMDSDGQLDILEINKLIHFIREYDIVIGTRSMRNDPLYRVLLGRLYNWLICLLFNIKLKDITCGFKLFNKVVLDKIELRSKGGLINAEILVRAAKRGHLIKEVDIKHFSRAKGKSSGANLKTSAIKIFETFKLWLELNINRGVLKRPL